MGEHADTRGPLVAVTLYQQDWLLLAGWMAAHQRGVAGEPARPPADGYRCDPRRRRELRARDRAMAASLGLERALAMVGVL
jgi:hypothetical protein